MGSCCSSSACCSCCCCVSSEASKDRNSVRKHLEKRAAATEEEAKLYQEHTSHEKNFMFFFVNGTSGGNVASKITKTDLKKFSMIIHDELYIIYIVDLKDSADRKKGFHTVQEVNKTHSRSVKVIACGGDGTVKWVISELKKIDCIKVPIGVIPFGTGNDMARVLGWGGHAPKELLGVGLKAFRKQIKRFADAVPIALDLWDIDIELNPEGKFLTVDGSEEVEAEPGLKTMRQEMINYFSVGADAQIVFEFEKHRKKTQIGNKVEYGVQGAKQILIQPQGLKEFITTVKDMKDLEVVDYGADHQALIFQNIPSYGGGQDLWSRYMLGANHLTEQLVGDNKLEVMSLASPSQVALSMATMGLSKDILNGIQRLRQSEHFEISFLKHQVVYLQVDGEGIKACDPCKVTIKCQDQVMMLRNEADNKLSALDQKSATPDAIQLRPKHLLTPTVSSLTAEAIASQNIFCMVNPTSGGNSASQLNQLMIEVLHYHHQDLVCFVHIHNLKDSNDRSYGFEKVQRLVNSKNNDVKVIACGGDGTVKWVISELKKIDCIKVPIGVIPFGTGNDMARVLGWGGHAPKELLGVGLKAFRKQIKRFADAVPIALDLWDIDIELNPEGRFLTVDGSEEVEAEPGLKTMRQEMINYFSVGADAQIVFEFEKHRKKTQIGNKVEYGVQGAKQILIKPKKLRKYLSEVKDSSGEVKYGRKDKALIFQNIPSYGGGQNLWRRHVGAKQFASQLVGDNKLEVMSLSSTKQVGLSMVTAGLSKDLYSGIKRVSQSSSFEISFKPDSTVYLQVDGEGIKAVDIKCITIKCQQQVAMLQNSKLHPGKSLAGSFSSSIAESGSLDIDEETREEDAGHAVLERSRSIKHIENKDKARLEDELLGLRQEMSVLSAGGQNKEVVEEYNAKIKQLERVLDGLPATDSAAEEQLLSISPRP